MRKMNDQIGKNRYGGGVVKVTTYKYFNSVLTKYNVSVMFFP